MRRETEIDENLILCIRIFLTINKRENKRGQKHKWRGINIQVCGQGENAGVEERERKDGESQVFLNV